MPQHKATHYLQHWLFGHVSFARNEEYAEFRYRLLIVLMFVGALFSALFILGEYAELNRMQNLHFVTMHLYVVISLLSWWVLRGRKHLYRLLVWVYEGFSLTLFSSALWLIPDDELRVMWFFVNVPGVFVLLGPRAGWAVIGLTITFLLFGNSRMATPYSTNALATGIASLLYLGAFFHAFGARSVSYFIRMREYNQQLLMQANHDPLTGVLNARAYYARCQELVNLARRTGRSYAVLFIDLDHFKSINDRYGHQAGDTVLRVVAATLASSIRCTDILGRIGGEEFSIFLPDTERAGAAQLAEILRSRVENCRPKINQLPLPVTASIGVAVCGDDMPEMDALQQNADQAMYAAKKMGRNRVSVFCRA